MPRGPVFQEQSGHHARFLNHFKKVKNGATIAGYDATFAQPVKKGSQAANKSVFAFPETSLSDRFH
jgi:hypothetical protein